MATAASHRRLADREREIKDNREAQRAVWGFVWTLFAFKILTVGVIWYSATSTGTHSFAMIAATTWYWLFIPIAAIAGPLMFRWRLLRMRRRREQLRGAEWMDLPAPIVKLADAAPGKTRH
ncbi:MAG: hypothetical protein M3451_01115 [Chloroflexota bacterium]|jgi:hypothetical protein|nr:hypothetical protein [Chloroflexota bacterium]